MKIYLAGPMSGYESYNFPAFFAAEEALKKQGYEVINPARLDEDAGYDPTSPDFVMDEAFLHGAAKRDLLGVVECDAIALLPNWEHSNGALAEFAVAKWLNKKIYLYPSMVEHGKESILDEAKRITSGARQKDYGHPRDNFKRIADFWNIYMLNRKHQTEILNEEDVAWMMVLLKIARDQNKPNKDNLLDTIGYTRTLAMIRGIEK
jgi:hypothetical protein